jgi:hypothetical protein
MRKKAEKAKTNFQRTSLILQEAFMTTTTFVTQSVEITDSTLFNFHNQRENAYKGTKEQIEKNYLSYSKEAEALEAFNEQVRHEGKLLQEGKVEPLPNPQKLENRKEEFLVQFEQFKASYEKLKEIAENIHKTIEFLKPAERSYAEEQSLKERSPELYAQTKRSEEICLNHVRELGTSHKSFVNLQSRMFTTLNSGELGWSLQRFCVIVDNQGKPLSWYTRSINYMTTPVVPKPKSQQQNHSSNAPSSNPHLGEVATVINKTDSTDDIQTDTTSVVPPSLNQIPSNSDSSNPNSQIKGTGDGTKGTGDGTDGKKKV